MHNNPVYRRSSVGQKRRRGSQQPPLRAVTDPTPPIEVDEDDDDSDEEVRVDDDEPAPVKLVRQHSM